MREDERETDDSPDEDEGEHRIHETLEPEPEEEDEKSENEEQHRPRARREGGQEIMREGTEKRTAEHPIGKERTAEAEHVRKGGKSTGYPPEVEPHISRQTMHRRRCENDTRVRTVHREDRSGKHHEEEHAGEEPGLAHDERDAEHPHADNGADEKQGRFQPPRADAHGH